MSGTLDEHLAAQLEREIMERDLAEIHKRLDEYELDLRSHYPKIEAKDKPETPAAAGLKDNPIKTA